jgi:hypothetical protein
MLLLDISTGEICLRSIYEDACPRLAVLPAIVLNELNELQVSEELNQNVSNRMYYPILRLSEAWLRDGIEKTIFSTELVRCIRDWIKLQIESKTRLIVLFQLGLPDYFRQILLDSLASIASLEMLAGVNAWTLALMQPGEDTELRFGTEDWSVLGTRKQLTRTGSRPVWSLEYLSMLHVGYEPDESLATTLWKLVACIEGEGHIELNMQPNLQIYSKDIDDECLKLSTLECESSGKIIIDRGINEILHFGCGHGSKWSGAEVLARVDLRSKCDRQIELNWQVSTTMELHLQLKTVDNNDISCIRQIPRPLIIVINRLKPFNSI